MDIASAYVESAVTGRPCSYVSRGLTITVHPNGRVVVELESSAPESRSAA